MAPLLLKMGAKLDSGMIRGQVTCHSKLNIHQFIILLEIHMLLWLMLWLRDPSIFLLGGLWQSCLN